MSQVDNAYHALLGDILASGTARQDRTGVGTRALFGRHIELDVRTEFPLITTRHVSFRVALLELLWTLKGKINTNWLNERGIKIWNHWAMPDGNLGPMAGMQWRRWPEHRGGNRDQITELIDGLRIRPHSRRHLLSTWNVEFLPDETESPQENAAKDRMALSPCQVVHQFYINDCGLSLLVFQRSADAFLGLPFDIANSSILLHMVARAIGANVDKLKICLGDVHLYSNHLSAAQTVLAREGGNSPTIVFRCEPKMPYDYEEEDVAIEGYSPHPSISAQVAI